MEQDSKDILWHTLNVSAVLERQQVNQDGLTDDKVCARRARFGDNCLPQPARRSWFVRFIVQFHNTLIYVLLISAAITALLNHWIDTTVIIAVVLINAIVGILQEGKAERALDAIKNMLALKAAVIRNGERKTVAAEELVPGDMVLLEAGDKVPADLRLIQSHGLNIEEAILTGESLAVEKGLDAVGKQAAL
ncbi:MAG: HAD-IC family P-type ATPase, partial [Kangiella sp.]|nr:HAD-IC family P-type ATPase [Kangiella sp.]